MTTAAVASTPLRAAPGPRGRPLLGNSPAFRRDVLGFFTRCAREHGDVVGFRLGPKPCCLVNDPALIERVLVGLDDRTLKAWDLRQLEFVLGRGLLTNEGRSWRRQRRLVQPAFHTPRLHEYARRMALRAADRAAAWRAGETIDVHAEMTALTLEIVGEALLGAELSGRVEAVGEALDRVMDRFERMLRGWLPIPLSFPTPGNLRARWALRRLDRVVYEVIARRRAAAEGGEGHDLLAVLLAAQDEEGTGTVRQLRDEVTTLLLAGHETTAIALSWTLWLVARHPEVEARLAEEVREVLGDRLPAAGDIGRLPRLRAAIQESMRLYPPAWGIGREPVEDVELGGFRIEKGTQIFMVPWVTHRDPRFFARPERFLPGRWDEDPSPPCPAGKLPKYAYFPFGGGPRYCIGRGFAMMEATMVLATLLGRWRFDTVPDHRVEPQPAVTLRPRGGIPMTPRRR